MNMINYLEFWIQDISRYISRYGYDLLSWFFLFNLGLDLSCTHLNYSHTLIKWLIFKCHFMDVFSKKVFEVMCVPPTKKVLDAMNVPKFKKGKFSNLVHPILQSCALPNLKKPSSSWEKENTRTWNIYLAIA